MAGRPLHRARRRAEEGRLFPVVPKPGDWQAKAIADRLEHNLGLSIDRCYDYLSVPVNECTIHMLAAQKEVAIAHIKAGFRYMLDRANFEDRTRILEEMRRELADHESKTDPAS